VSSDNSLEETGRNVKGKEPDQLPMNSRSALRIIEPVFLECVIAKLFLILDSLESLGKLQCQRQFWRVYLPSGH
jgi:hypothetical protein